MIKIASIIEHKDVAKYLLSRNILKKYKKQKVSLLKGEFDLVNFRKRRPFSKNTWYFRIDKKFRAHCFFEKDVLKVFRVDDHQ